MKPARRSALLTLACSFGLLGCAEVGDTASDAADDTAGARPGAGSGEVELVEGSRNEPAYADASLEITAPRPGQVFDAGQAAVSMRVTGFEPGVPTAAEPPHGVAVSEDGQHIHLVVDEEPYQAIYDLDRPVDLGDLSPGPHLLRAFPARQWHESVKSPDAYASSWFFVGDSAAVPFDPGGPLLTYSRPKGEYSGSAADTIMVDFYLSNASPEDGYTVRLTVDDSLSWDLDRWAPHYLVGLEEGEHRVRLELLGPDGQPAGGELSATERRIQVVRQARGEASPSGG